MRGSVSPVPGSATESRAVLGASKPVLAVLFWEGHLVLSPSLTSALRGLADAGYAADVFMRGGDDGMPELGAMPPAVRIVKSEAAGRLRKAYPDQVQTLRFAGAMGALIYAVFVWWKMRKRHYDAVIGVDAVGGVTALMMAKLRGIPLIVWSLELSFGAEMRNPLKRWLKALERMAFRNARWIVVQDARRAAALVEENRPGHARLLLVPNSPAGRGALRHSDMLHRILGIERETRIVLHAGMLDRTVLSYELAQSVGAWPEGYCLVLNGSFRRRAEEPYIKRILDLGDPRVYVKLAPTAEDEFDDLVASARFGLAIYDVECGPNYTLIVSASGKLPTYLRNGVPVICQDLPGMRDMIEGYGCGVVVGEIGEIPAAMEKMERDYERYRARALECYAREYEFSGHFGKVLEALEAEIKREF